MVSLENQPAVVRAPWCGILKYYMLNDAACLGTLCQFLNDNKPRCQVALAALGSQTISALIKHPLKSGYIILDYYILTTLFQHLGTFLIGNRWYDTAPSGNRTLTSGATCPGTDCAGLEMYLKAFCSIDLMLEGLLFAAQVSNYYTIIHCTLRTACCFSGHD